MLFNGANKAKVSQANTILIIVLVVLIILSVVIVFINSHKSTNTPLSNLINKVDSIEVVNNGEVNSLVKNDDQWVLANHNDQAAKQEYVQAIFSAFDDLIVTDVVSSNPDKQSVYEVDDSGIKVVMKSGDKVLEDFIIGKNGPSWPSSYIRWQNEDDVYLVRQTLPQLFGWGDWRNMTIVQLSPDLITELSWSNGLHIIKQDDAWQVVEPKELSIEETKIKTVLDNLANLEGTDIADINAGDLNQTEADFILEVKTTDEATYRLAFWNHPKDEGDYDYYVVKEGDDNVYILSKYIAENMEKKIEFFEK